LATSWARAQAPTPTQAKTETDRAESRRILRELAKEASWHDPLSDVKLEPGMLSEAIEKARIYYLAQQLPAGNFVYGRDVTTNETVEDDSQVRQAGALWGLASLNRDRPTLATARAVIRGLHFFLSSSRPMHMGPMAPIYPGSGEIKTGTVALVTLALVELWRGEEQYLTRMGRGLCSNWATQYLAYLGAMEMDNGSWGRCYYVESGQREAISSPYFDGESLLAYCRAARYMDHKELIPKIEKIAPLLVKKYTIDAWRADPDSDLTKGFFQWGCMSFAEYVEAGWKDADLIADACLALAWWEIHVHKVEEMRANTGYAVEGLLAAYKVAKLRGNQEAMQSLRPVIERLLIQQISTQVGGPLEKYNHFLTSNRSHKECVGAILNSPTSGSVRIDVVQHEVHAMVMAMDLFYK
jgi:UDP-N-acetylmuramoyl-tripeptide--D-alanyl-D-alanine ligase